MAPFPLQKTWAPLIRFMFVFRGETDVTSAHIREVQANDFGTQHGDSVLAELLPMPSPGPAHLPYSALAEQIPTIRVRTTYADALRQPRISTIRESIQSGKPKAAVPHPVAHGMTHAFFWTELGALMRSDVRD